MHRNKSSGGIVLFDEASVGGGRTVDASSASSSWSSVKSLLVNSDSKRCPKAEGYSSNTGSRTLEVENSETFSMGSPLNVASSYGTHVKFDSPQSLSSFEHDHFVDTARDAFFDMLNSCNVLPMKNPCGRKSPVGWKYLATKRGVRLYEEDFQESRHLEMNSCEFYDVGLQARGSTPQGIKRVKGLCSINGTLEEVIQLNHGDTSEEYRDNLSRISTDMLDACVLNCLQPRTTARPSHFINLKWVLTKTPPFVSNRDICFLEYADEFITMSGRRGWARCQHSTNVPWCPDIGRGYVRATAKHTGMIFIENPTTGKLDVSHVVNVHPNGYITNMAVFQILKRRVLSVLVLERSILNHRLSQRGFQVYTQSTISQTRQTCCTICQKSFRKAHIVQVGKNICGQCGQIVCRHCYQSWKLQCPVFGTKKVKICSSCQLQASNGGTGSQCSVPKLK